MGVPAWTQRPAPVAPPGPAKVRNSDASHEAPGSAGEASTCGYMFSYDRSYALSTLGFTHFRLQAARLA